MTVKWQTPLFGFVLLLLIGAGCWIAFHVHGCPTVAVKDAPAGCFEFWFNRYQTLLSAGAAFAAAYVTVRPVWRQLNLASIQTNVALREAISSQVNLIASRADKTNARLEKLATDLLRGHRDTEGTGAFSHWAWDMDSVIDSEIATLHQELGENIDRDETTISRTILISALGKLERCLSDVNATVHLERDDERADDPALNDEAAKTETLAEQQLPDCIRDTTEAISKLRSAFQRDIDELRLKRQLLDNVLVASETN
jgi:hypothetical protein